jgi:hypothetical protein
MRSFRVLALTALILGSCILDPSIDDFTFELPEKTFQVDTDQIQVPTRTTLECVPDPDSCAQLSPDLVCGAGNVCEVLDPEEIPAIPCDAEDDPCPALGPEFSCDLGAGSCMGKFYFSLMSPVNLSSEVPELQTIGQAPLVSVEFDHVSMRVEENSLSVPTPEIRFYLSPQTVSSLWVAQTNPPQLSPGIVPMGTLPPVAANTWGMTVPVALDAQGNATLTEYCRQPSVPFNMFAGTVIELHAGDPVPSGKIKLVVDSAATASLH